MKRITTKYMYLSVFIISLIAFLINTINHYLVILIAPSFGASLLIFGLFAVVLAIIITVGIAAFDPVMWEAIYLSRRLHRFENLSNPLLLKLSTRAPGTYHHSINVSNLAHQAAKAVGADALLVRTAAYYHDIGKLASPNFFVENQSHQEIPHDPEPEKLTEMAKKIINHVEYGIKFGRENHLPDEIIDLIQQHHGTTRVLYFYEKAKESGILFKKTDFRYDGPKPLSKEAAILMIADAVEATARAMPALSTEKIKEIIAETIIEKINDNQFKNASFSDGEIAKIKSALEETLIAIYHQRIEYKKNGSN